MATISLEQKKEFVDAIANNIDNKTNLELAIELGISETTFYIYLKKFKLTKKDELKELAQRYSAEQIANLRRMAAGPKGDSRAAAILLQIAELYEPKKRIEKQQTSIHFHITGLNIPKNAGLSDADPEAIPERIGTPVEANYSVISNNQEQEPMEVQVEDSQDNEESQIDPESEKGW